MNFVVFGRTWDRNDVTWKWLQHLQEEGTKCIGVAGPINFLPFLRFEYKSLRRRRALLRFNLNIACNLQKPFFISNFLFFNRFLPKFKQTINFLMNGKQATHRIYQRIIDEQSKILLKQNISEADCTNFIDAFLIERQKREHIEEYQKFYCEKQFHHLLADVFGAGLDTTLTTLRYCGSVNWRLFRFTKATLSGGTCCIWRRMEKCSNWCVTRLKLPSKIGYRQLTICNLCLWLRLRSLKRSGYGRWYRSVYRMAR